MRDIAIGLLIILVAFLIIDFKKKKKNTCIINDYTNEEVKCGVIKKQLNIDIDLFGRYW